MRGRWGVRLTEFHLECPPDCSLREGTEWGPLVTKALVDGASLRTAAAEVVAAGGKANHSTIARHKRHIVVHQPDASTEDAPAKANNIEILEAIIQKGFANQKNWKPTISDTMKAMDMWFRLTQGNPFDDLLDTLASASMASNDPAEGAADEREPVDDAEG